MKVRAPARTSTVTLGTQQNESRIHRPRLGVLAIALSALAILGAGCSGSTETGGGTSGATPSASSGGNESSSTFTVKFAECMRANGVPNFPNPNGQGNELGPQSGIDPTSPAFQNAINGPCKSLAPQGWVSSGPVTRGGGS
jgi:hypothetical protein